MMSGKNLNYWLKGRLQLRERVNILEGCVTSAIAVQTLEKMHSGMNWTLNGMRTASASTGCLLEMQIIAPPSTY